MKVLEPFLHPYDDWERATVDALAAALTARLGDDFVIGMEPTTDPMDPLYGRGYRLWVQTPERWATMQVTRDFLDDAAASHTYLAKRLVERMARATPTAS